MKCTGRPMPSAFPLEATVLAVARAVNSSTSREARGPEPSDRTTPNAGSAIAVAAPEGVTSPRQNLKLGRSHTGEDSAAGK